MQCLNEEVGNRLTNVRPLRGKTALVIVWYYLEIIKFFLAKPEGPVQSSGNVVSTTSCMGRKILIYLKNAFSEIRLQGVVRGEKSSLQSYTYT